MYEYSAKLADTPERAVYDGDTVKLTIDLGFNIKRTESCRLYGVNVPELRTGDKKEEAKAARDWLREKLRDKELIVKTFKDKQEKYGRILVEILVKGDVLTVNQQLVVAGHAVPYFGKGKIV